MLEKWHKARGESLPPTSDRSQSPGRLAIAFLVLLLLAGAISVHSYFRMVRAVDELNVVVIVAATAQEIEEATHDMDQLALACVMAGSGRPRSELDTRWRRIDTALKRLQGIELSRRGQTAVLALERLTVTLRERVAALISHANQGEQTRFAKSLDGVAEVVRYIASECGALVADDLGYFSRVQATIRNRTAQTALIIILSVAVVLILSLVGQAVVFSERIREIRQNQAQKERLLEALSTKGRDLERQIEERTRAEEALRQSEAYVVSLFDSIRDAVVATDRRGNVTRVNPVAQEWLGDRDRTCTGVDVRELLHLRGREPMSETAEIVTDVLDTGAPYTSVGPLTLARPAQSELPVSANISAIRSPVGELVGCVIVLRDVSEALAIQERTQHAAKMEAIGQLAGGVAHDFNNLLTGLNGCAELLLGSLPPESPEAALANQIQQTGERAAELVRHLLGFARRGQMQLASVNLHSIIEEVMALLGHSVDKRIKLVRQLNAARPWVKGDSSQLQNALLNLGLNARDAMPDGGEFVVVTRNECHGGADVIELEVSDTGCGIPPEVLDRIFEPFFTTKEQGKGTGLGLASVYGCVHSHQGDIHVESTPGRGSVFRIRMPVVEAPPVGAETAAQKTERALLRGLVVVVDDEDIVRSVASRNLKRLGFEVLATGEAREALAWIAERAGQVTLVLLDMSMPQMSGAEVFRAIRELDPRVPVLLISGNATTPEVQALEQAGSVRFLAKPFLSGDLARELELLLRHERRGTSD